MQDREAKKRLGYTHPKSRVWTDGQGNVVRESLRGEDWKRRVEELLVRSGGRCEYTFQDRVSRKILRCFRDAVDPCHVEPRHPIRNDMMSNLMAGCRSCHEKHEKQSWRRLRWSSKETAA